MGTCSPELVTPLVDVVPSGGVRGIVELVVLEALMKRIGHDLPIQELFDVIVGAGTGA